ncbi:archaemetzincin [Taibaiella sp. KBW10]|uniref:archaemetzincin n=1 Tax=Taibaiella sp. KBW10 TaxID=2153357 RepID=UPI0013154762|nr:archaemetzincin [Taibaiella sp. KBW10]
MRHTLLMIVILLLFSCNDERGETFPHLRDCYRLQTLSAPIHPIREGEWRSLHTEVPVPLKIYMRSAPARADQKRTKLYVMKIGDFDATGNLIFDQASAYLQAYYQIQVDTVAPLDIKSIPLKYTRKRSEGLQLNSSYIITNILPERKPDSAFALIAFSLYDLYPDEQWNFVFGQASLNTGVGVWSLARLGDYKESPEQYRICLERTLKVAAHETGHMLGIQHCVKYECSMNGSNSLLESDLQPEWLCWECLAKLCWNRNTTPQAHLAALLRFHETVTHNRKSIPYYRKALGLLPVQKTQ